MFGMVTHNLERRIHKPSEVELGVEPGKVGFQVTEPMTETMNDPRWKLRLIAFVGALVTSALCSSWAWAQSVEEPTLRVFPRESLFAPLAADLRWPRFALGYLYHFDDADFTHIGTVDAGASIAIVQQNRPGRGSWEIGIQGGVFSIFDFGAPSNDLVNADYLGGITFTYAFDSLSILTRIIHQSSHLGDEFLLNNEVERLNLSFEELGVLLSYDPFEWLRAYAGAGVMVRREPSNLDRWSLEGGLEFRPFTTSTKHRLEILLALDVRFWQQSSWQPDASLVAGVTLDPVGESSYRVDFLIKYYNGHSPNGQFFTRRIQTLGPSIHLYF
ncbi:MAG: DUF1207 domain-containing protein [Deltaproteobacteria bacterium]|nr:MAG: DUF1207 domain-containing protein [Deltaproteobacteria bacterium]